MLKWIPDSALQDGDGKLLAYVGASIQMHATPRATRYKLQCRADDPVDIKAIEVIFNSRVPTMPHELVRPQDSIFWQSPNEWLIVSANVNASTWRQDLSDVLSGQVNAITDLTDSLTVIEIGGENSRALLAQGCCVDIHTDTFSTGQYVTTRFFQLRVLIHRISEKPAFRVYVDRSEALHLWRLMESRAKIFNKD